MRESRKNTSITSDCTGEEPKRTFVWVLLVILAMFLIAIAISTACYINEIRVARLQKPDLITTAPSRYGTPSTLTDLSSERRAMLIRRI